MTKTFHPEFDGRQWSVQLDGGKVITANAICHLIPKLKEQLGCPVCIKDYYPLGKRMPRPIWPKPVDPKTLAAVEAVKPPDPPPPPRKIPIKAYKYDHDQILNLWELGWSTVQIAEYLRYDSSKAVGQIVCNARALGDPRAISRQAKRAEQESHLSAAAAKRSARG